MDGINTSRDINKQTSYSIFVKSILRRRRKVVGSEVKHHNIKPTSFAPLLKGEG